MKNTRYGIRYIIEDKLKNVGIPLDKGSAKKIVEDLTYMLGSEKKAKKAKTGKQAEEIRDILQDILDLIDYLMKHVKPETENDKEEYEIKTGILTRLYEKIKATK